MLSMSYCIPLQVRCGLASLKLGQCPRDGCEFNWNDAAEIIGVEPDSIIAEENVESVL